MRRGDDSERPECARSDCVSVIIPARNAASTIEATIASLAENRAPIREIILVDDGSDDGTARSADAAAARSRLPLTVVSGNFRNAGAARNVGLKSARGDFLYFLDADDEALPEGLRALVECLRSDPSAGLAVGGYVRRSDGRTDKPRLPDAFASDRLLNAHKYLRNELRSIAMGSALVRHEVVVGIRFPETLRFDEDTLFWAAVLSRAHVAAVQRVLLVYNVGDGRFVDRFTLDARGEFLKLACEMKNLRAFGIDDSVLKWRKGWIARRIARAFINIGDPVSARRFLRAARAHPKLRQSPTTLRYAVRIRLSELRRTLAQRIGLGEIRSKAGSS